MAKKRTGKTLIVLTLSFVMAFSMITPAFGATQLDTPVVEQNQNFRWLIYTPVEGATGYNVYAFATHADAVAGTDYVAVARNVVETIGSTTAGGTTLATAPEIPEGQNRIDVRLLQFEGDATRTLPAGYTPAGLGDSWFPGDAQGNTTNLKPGQYWFRLRAVSDDDTIQSSELSAVNAMPFTIAMGPDEFRAFVEANLDKIGTPALRFVDLRNPAEFAAEGNVRFFTAEDRHLGATFATQEDAEAIFGTDKDIYIVVVCRGGGRTVAASQNLAMFGYTNVINAQGVNQITFGLVYDDPTFTLRGPGNTADLPVAPFIADGEITWLNVPRAMFEIFAFRNATETNVSYAAARATAPVMEQDLTGSNNEHSWVRTFDLAELGLDNIENYYIRMRAVPAVNEPVRGSEDNLYWGAPSALSDPLTGIAFDDVHPDAWYFAAVMYANEEDIMEGFPDGTFRPETALTRAQVVTILYRLADSPEIDERATPFADVGPGQWWTDQILWAYEEGVTTGFVQDGERTFRGSQNVTMEELATFVARFQEANDSVPPRILEGYEWPDYMEVAAWARNYVGILTAQGLFRDLPGDNFAPQSDASRAVVASVIHNWLTSLNR